MNIQPLHDYVAIQPHKEAHISPGESPRVCRRLHFLRGLEYEQVSQIFPGSPGTGGAVSF